MSATSARSASARLRRRRSARAAPTASPAPRSASSRQHSAASSMNDCDPISSRRRSTRSPIAPAGTESSTTGSAGRRLDQRHQRRRRRQRQHQLLSPDRLHPATDVAHELRRRHPREIGERNGAHGDRSDPALGVAGEPAGAGDELIDPYVPRCAARTCDADQLVATARRGAAATCTSACSFESRSVNRISTNSGTVGRRAQSRWSSQSATPS